MAQLHLHPSGLSKADVGQAVERHLKNQHLKQYAESLPRIRDTDGLEFKKRSPVNGETGVGTPGTPLQFPPADEVVFESGLFATTSWIDDSFVQWSVGDSIRGQLLPSWPLEVMTFSDPVLGSVDAPTFTSTRFSTIVNDAELKRVQIVYPASLYSGLLRLYVQSVYGTAREDYSEVGSNLEIGGKSLGHRGSIGSSIFRTSSYDYFLLDVSDDTLNAYELVPLSGFDALATTMRLQLATATGDYKKFCESLLFAMLTPSGTLTDTVNFTITVSDPAIPLGNPLGYAWRANSDGSKLRAVWVYLDSCAEGMQSRDVELEITHDEETNTFAVTPAVLDDRGAIVETNVWVWTPNSGNPLNQSYLATYFCPFVGPCTPLVTGSDEFSALPIYGWWDSLDEWVSTTVSRSITDESDSGGSTLVETCGFSSDENKIISRATGTGSDITWSCGGGSRKARWYSSQVLEEDANMNVAPGATYFDPTPLKGISSIPYTVCSGTPGPNPKCLEYTDGLFNYQRVRSRNRWPQSRAVLVIPPTDCEAAFVVTVDANGNTNHRMDWYHKAGNCGPTRVKTYDFITGQGSDTCGEGAEGPPSGDADFLKKGELLPGGLRQEVAIVKGEKHTDAYLIAKDGEWELITNSLSADPDSTAPPGSSFTDEEKDFMTTSPLGVEFASAVAAGDAGWAADDGGWGTFCDIPADICVGGSRILEQNPWIKQSAVFGDRMLPSQLAMATLTPDGGYLVEFTGDTSYMSFVGAA